LSYCSRSGAPSTPWLEPDINDHLADLAAAGHAKVVLAPIGFVSDHMEVVWDLDTEAAGTARGLGFEVARSATVGVAERFITGLVDLVVERAARERGRTRPCAFVANWAPSQTKPHPGATGCATAK